MKAEIEAKAENLYEINKICEGFIDEKTRSTLSYETLLVAIEEIFVNITSYAYQGKPGKAVFEIEYIDKNRVRVQFSDSGEPFDPLEFDSNKKAESNLQSLIPGGLGIRLVKRITKNLSYHYENGKNILSFEKTMEEM